MNFTSFEFVAFFGLLLLARVWARRGAAELWLLLAASALFYLTWSVPCILLVGFTILMDYNVGRRLAATEDPAARSRWLWLSVACNLGMLGFFKYTNFFLENVQFILGTVGVKAALPHLDIVLPPAISYFTFASLSYVVDVYYERGPACERLRDYGLFIMFFPKLLSGPITRARDFLPQLVQRPPVTPEDVEIGLARFLVGAVKKLVIADQVAGNVGLIFAAPGRYDALTLAQGLCGFVTQLYCDFSGYSDMAIGLARLLGFRLPENFQMPFSATDITDFWRRWHMSLSAWLRDYIFLPLEILTRDNPNATRRAALNILVTFVLCGLWHGASWNFILWGAIMGTALAVHLTWRAWNPLRSWKGRTVLEFGWRQFSRVLTLGLVLLSFVFARAATLADAGTFLKRLLTFRHDGTRLISPYIVPAVVVVVLAHFVLRRDGNWVAETVARPVWYRILAYSALLIILTFLAATEGAPFIYFKF